MKTAAKTRRAHGRGTMWLAAVLGAWLGIPAPGSQAGVPDDAVAREFSVFAGSLATVLIADAAAREFSVFSGSLAGVSVADATAREFSVFSGSLAGIAVRDAVAREFSVMIGGPQAIAVTDAAAREFSVFAGSLAPVAVRDAVAREFSVIAGGVPFVPATDAVAREFSVLVPTAPVITLNPATLSYLEGDGTVVIDPTALVRDPDSDDFGGGYLRVELLEGGSPGDALSIAELPDGAITLSPENEILFEDVAIGTAGGGGAAEPLLVQLNENATIAATQALVRVIAFANPTRRPAAGLRQVGFTLSDGLVGEGPTATRGIMVQPLNQAPVAGPDFVGAARDVPLVFPVARLLANDSDPDNDEPLVVAFPGANTTQGGTVELLDDMVTYTPPPGFTGTDRFSYSLSDPFGGVGTATVTAFVRAPDDPSVTVLELGMTGDGFALAMIGLPGKTYQGFASRDLSDWGPFAVEEADEIGSLRFLDPEAGTFASRFYRFAFPNP